MSNIVIINQEFMESEILDLFFTHFGIQADRIAPLPLSGSARRYFRLWKGERSYIGVYNRNVEENRLFIDFTAHFRACGLAVPEVMAVSEDRLTYIQEDLGEFMLLDVVEQEREQEYLSGHLLSLYRKALSGLLRFQLQGGVGLDYSGCVPRPVFDRQCVMWDLNYFKYCFLRLAAADFAEQELENDFNKLADIIDNEPAEYFMFRDFQSRNIMVKDDEVFFIDYQGGRKGALCYDVASLLYDAIVKLPDSQREELLDYYTGELDKVIPLAGERFRKVYDHFVLVRLLQAMGAFGLRGLYEGKQHFVDSIIPGLQNILSLFTGERLAGQYPAIEKVCRQVLQRRQALQ